MIISLDKAVTLLLSGSVIGIPTDTVYGLAAHLDHLNAINDIFKLKGRSKQNPLIILAANTSQIEKFLLEKSKMFDSLANRFWPGALTLIVKVNENILPNGVISSSGKTGFRIPDCKELLELLEITGPLATTSANISGEKPPMVIQEVENYFGENFPVIYLNGFLSGKPSTVVELNDSKYTVIRQGSVHI